jgi:hypothetical protein
MSMLSRIRPASSARAVALLGCALGAAHAESVSISSFRNPGMGVDWSAATNVVAYDVLDARSGYWQVNLCNPDGSGDRALSPGVPGLPTRSSGSPAWYPDGSFVVATVEKQSHPGSSYDATPGLGTYSDLWAIAANGSWSVQLTNVPDDANHGTIGGHFSKDGKHLVWTEMVQAPNIFVAQQTFGVWVVQVADVTVVGGRPSVANVRTVNPGGGACFNEAYGFSPDSARIIFASSFNQSSPWTDQIVTTALDGSALVQITSNGAYNEHAVWRPDGSAIVWMNTLNSPLGGTDWWMMAPDGTNAVQLTYFNTLGHPECTGAAQWAGLVSFSPDGSSMLGGVETSLFPVAAWIARVQNLPASPATGGSQPTKSGCGAGSASGIIVGALMLGFLGWRRRQR